MARPKKEIPPVSPEQMVFNLAILGHSKAEIARLLDIDPHTLESRFSTEYAKGKETGKQKLRAKLPETKVLLLGIFPRGANSEDRLRQVNAKTNAIAAKLADGKQVVYLDIGKVFLQPDGALAKEIMPDLLHLSPKGYRLWAEAIEPEVEKVLGKE